MRLNELSDMPGATKNRIRVGRGIGSGKGKTGGRGVKGQKSRSGVAIKGFEGGQMPIHMRLPKRGFNSRNRKNYTELSIANLERAIAAGKIDAKTEYDASALVAAGVIRREKDGVRLIGAGTLSKAVTLHVVGATPGAKKAVEAAKGSVTLIDTAMTRRAKGEKSDKSGKVSKADKKANAASLVPAKEETPKSAKAKPVKKAAAKPVTEKAPAAKKPAKTAKKDEARHAPYFKNITEKYDAKADEAVVKAITSYLGASLSNRDAKYVSCTDETERNTVRDSFLKKKLGLKDENDVLDEKVNAVCAEMKPQRMKDRVTFYYLLAKNEGMLSEFS